MDVCEEAYDISTARTCEKRQDNREGREQGLFMGLSRWVDEQSENARKKIEPATFR
jgi:hypothetical protein